jgi:hypothetical protein
MAGMKTPAQRRRGSASACGLRLTGSALGVAIAIATALALGVPSASADPLARAVAGAEAPVAQLAPERPTTAPGGGIVRRYEQRVDGLPVLGAEVVAVDGPETAPMGVSDSTVGAIEPVDRSNAISRAAAIDAARRATGVAHLRASADAQLGIDPASGRLVWEVSLPAEDPVADWLVVVDARSGAKLRARDVLLNATGAGSIFNPNPVVQQGGYSGLKDKKDRDTDRLTSLLVPVALERLTTTNGCLKGLYVDSRVSAKGKKVCAPGADFTGLTRSAKKFEAVMAYFHVDRTRFYADSLTLSQPLRSKPQKVFSNAIPDDNSFYSSMTQEMVIGSGGVDDGEDADVIVHEYGHSLQDQASPGPLRKRERATMGEGFGDYLAAAMSALTTGGSPFDTCIFDWDGISYSPDGTCGRYADIPATVTKAERKCAKQIHCVGQIWSSTLFDLREQLGVDANGQSIMDRIVLEANFLLTGKSGYKDGARSLLAADQLLYGGANNAAIETAMVARKFCGASC